MALQNAAKKEPSLIGKSLFAFIAERLVILREWTSRRSSLAPRLARLSLLWPSASRAQSLHPAIERGAIEPAQDLSLTDRLDVLIAFRMTASGAFCA